MRKPTLIIAAVGLAAAAGVGGVTAAATTGSSGASAPRSSTAGPGRIAAVHSTHAAVDGHVRNILVDRDGMPLYYYRPDTPTESLVAGGLARLWPPLTSAAATGGGAPNGVTVVHDNHGDQVANRGHLLYTFLSDAPGRVTGQGIQNFFVATPTLSPIGSGPAGSAPPAPAGGYGY
jgi:predicted lipoprotein with Yx(FWY)xxD motif